MAIDLKQMPPKKKRFAFLRKQYPTFKYVAHEWSCKGQNLRVQFKFESGDLVFQPGSTIKFPNAFDLSKLSSNKKKLIDNLVFQIGMIEMLSYWKAVCSPTIELCTTAITKSQMDWWKKLYYQGLGEYLYLNSVKVDQNGLVNFKNVGKEKYTHSSTVKSKERTYLIPIGGGKDSLATVEILKKSKAKKFFLLMNPTKAAKDSAKAATTKWKEECVFIKRIIDPALLDCNAKGYLNGHTPFSAMLAFYSNLVSVIIGAKHTILSNESSANEPTILGTNINHQYSKSYEFEKDFNQYLKRYVSSNYQYFSLLRPINEFQIVSIFSSNSKNLKIFKSCNVGSKKDIWCCNCSKCLFVFILLSAKIGIEKTVDVFGENLFLKKGLKQTFEELIGRSKHKPFECIGTIDEVNVAITCLHQIDPTAFNKMYLLKRYKSKFSDSLANQKQINSILNQFDKKHRLNPSFKKMIHEVYAEANKE